MMKTWVFLFAALLVPLSGCIAEGDPTTTPPPEEPAPELPPPEPPADIAVEAMMGPSLDPLNAVGEGICSAPTATCDRHAFSIENGTFTLSAALEWMVPANDFDLYLVQGSTVVASSGNAPPDFEALQASVNPGDYELIVVGWAVAGDTYTLTGTFA